MKQIGVLGVGNTLLGDDGFGPCCVQRFMELYQIPDNVHVLDGGTSALFLAPFLDDLDVLYVVDTVSGDGDPGTIHCFSEEQLAAGDLQRRMSPHQVGLMEILELCRLRDTAPDVVEMLTVIPKDMSVKMGLSSKVEPAVVKVIALLVERLAQCAVILQENSDELSCKI